MKFSTQLYKAGLEAPPGFAHQRTSQLVSRGLLAHNGYPGIPTYTPIGIEVLSRIETELIAAANRAGFSRVQLPSIMKDADLTAGEPVGEQFHSKVLFLSDMLDGYHLLTSPEMLLTGALGSTVLSHRELPVRVSYLTDIFRQMRNTRSILRCHQFRVFGGLTLERGPGQVGRSLAALAGVVSDALADFGVAVFDRWKQDPVHIEQFYACAEGSTTVDDAESLTGRSKALSLAVGYHYAADMPPVVNYRTAANTLNGAAVTTYALCTNRVLYAVFDRHRDALGFALPAHLRPFDLVVVPTDSESVAAAEALYTRLGADGVRTALDDRQNRPVALRHRFADYVGAAARLEPSRGRVRLIERGGRVLADVTDVDEAVSAARRLLDRATAVPAAAGTAVPV
ncbi:hypothetical protein ACFVUY_27375 [Kitasatospora sp. NPDC058063]|uniref:hypothetical protein n=1 Tax=unclassified Kitasatospora TaxID=2633591 RepID=UPI0036DC40FF